MRGRNETGRAIRRDVGREPAGTEDVLDRRLPTLAVDAVHRLAVVTLIGGEDRRTGLHGHAQDDRRTRQADFMTTLLHGDCVDAFARHVRGLVMPPERDERSDADLDRRTAQHSIANADRVLLMDHHDRFLQHDSFDVVGPARDAAIEGEVPQEAMAFAEQLAIGELDIADVIAAIAGDDEFIAA